jgi:hypothetical protein
MFLIFFRLAIAAPSWVTIMSTPPVCKAWLRALSSAMVLKLILSRYGKRRWCASDLQYLGLRTNWDSIPTAHDLIMNGPVPTGVPANVDENDDGCAM